MPTSHTLPTVTESSLLSNDQFMDVAYASPLLGHHGAGIECDARLEVLIPAPALVPTHVDVDHADLDLQRMHVSSSGSQPMHEPALGSMPAASIPPLHALNRAKCNSLMDAPSPLLCTPMHRVHMHASPAGPSSARSGDND
jgi:hypothetical protein